MIVLFFLSGCVLCIKGEKERKKIKRERRGETKRRKGEGEGGEKNKRMSKEREPRGERNYQGFFGLGFVFTSLGFLWAWLLGWLRVLLLYGSSRLLAEDLLLVP